MNGEELQHQAKVLAENLITPEQLSLRTSTICTKNQIGAYESDRRMNNAGIIRSEIHSWG